MCVTGLIIVFKYSNCVPSVHQLIALLIIIMKNSPLNTIIMYLLKYYIMLSLSVSYICITIFPFVQKNFFCLSLMCIRSAPMQGFYLLR